MATSLLDQAIIYAKTGKSKKAIQMLVLIVEKEPWIDRAWLWLALCTEEKTKKKEYLKRTISINPYNYYAIDLLENLEQEEEIKDVKNKKKRKQIEVKFRKPKIYRSHPEDDFFFGFSEGINQSARLETGVFGKSVIVDGVRFSNFEGPSCLLLKKERSPDICDSCEYFSPRDCILRFDEYLAEDLNRFKAIRLEKQAALVKRSRNIAKVIHEELKTHGRPLHYTVIAKIIADRYPKLRVTSKGIYHFIIWHPELFEKVDTGVYRAK